MLFSVVYAAQAYHTMRNGSVLPFRKSFTNFTTDAVCDAITSHSSCVDILRIFAALALTTRAALVQQIKSFATATVNQHSNTAIREIPTNQFPFWNSHGFRI